MKSRYHSGLSYKVVVMALYWYMKFEVVVAVDIDS